jgi:coenzyme Q-binding protein COQ10
LYSYTAVEIYDVVVDVSRYREFVPWCIRSDIIKPAYPNMFKAQMEIGFQVIKEQYTALVTYQKPTMVKVLVLISFDFFFY